MTDILKDVGWYHTVVLICIYLIISNVEHLLMWPLAICTSSFVKFLFRSSLHFWLGSVYFFILSCNSCLYILDINFPFPICFCSSLFISSFCWPFCGSMGFFVSIACLISFCFGFFESFVCFLTCSYSGVQVCWPIPISTWFKLIVI